MNDEGKGMVMLIWQCDKEDCQEMNRRWIEIDQGTIFDDVCEYCNRRIHEPLTAIITEIERNNEE
jgi:hypothetical protein